MNSSESATKQVHLQGPPLDWPRHAGKVDLVLRDIEGKLRLKHRRRARATKTAVAAVFLVSLATWAVPFMRQTDQLATPSAIRQTIALADGSSAELNARTSLRTDFRYGRRTVELTQGEAYFSVVKDPAHPFFVKTPLGTVRVTGTKFNIRLTGNNAGEITLLEGAVTVESSAGPALELTPSQQVAYGKSSPSARTLTDDQLAGVIAWREGLLRLDGLTLQDAALRFAAYHGKDIVVDGEVASLRMGGSCALDDLPGFLEYLPKALSVKVWSKPDGSFRIVAQ